MKAIVVSASISLILSVFCCVVSASASGEYPKTVHGKLSLPDMEVVFDTEFWDDSCPVENFLPRSRGLHDAYWESRRQWHAALTIDAMAAVCTLSSRERIEEMRPGFDRIIAARKEGKIKYGNGKVLISVAVQHGTVQQVYVVEGKTGVNLADSGPPFAVQIMTQEDGAWKRDLGSMGKNNAIFMLLQHGHWRQFGAPQDYTREAVDRRAAATQPTTQPATSPAKRDVRQY